MMDPNIHLVNYLVDYSFEMDIFGIHSSDMSLWFCT